MTGRNVCNGKRAGHSTSSNAAEQQAAEAIDLSERTYVIETGRVSIEGASSSLATNDSIRRSYLGVR